MTAVTTLAKEGGATSRGIGTVRIAALALRDLRSGLGGFYIFIACLALGVAVIAGVGSLSDALRTSFARQGEQILGGDVTLARMHARATEREKAWFAERGRVSETVTMRTMARTLDGSEQSLAELKAADDAYPLVGEIGLRDGVTLRAAVHDKTGAAVDPILLERLGLKVGDKIRLGEAEVPVTAVIDDEPDKLLDRLTYGARVLVSQTTLDATKLIQPGTLARWRYALDLNEQAASGEEPLQRFRERVQSELPESGFTIADRRDPSPQITRTLERLRQFLTLIGLTALLVGGVGVANAVATFIDRRRKTIATFKSLGAQSRTVFQIFLTQVLLIAAIGVAVGLALGLLVPLVLEALYASSLPIPTQLSLSWTTVLTATVYGFLVALLFALWPLGRAGQVSSAVLFRDNIETRHARPSWLIIGLVVAAGAALAAMAIWTSDARLVAVYFVGGVLVVFAVFWAIGLGIVWAAKRVQRPARPELALALRSLGAPGGLTQTMTLSLGAGLSLLVAVALANASITSEFRDGIPEKSPNYFVLDIPKGDLDAVKALVQRAATGAQIEEAPMLRGRLVKVKDQAVETLKVPPEAEWVLNGDRGLTYADALPNGSKLVAGSWWAKDYAGEPLVSFETDLARNLGLAIGDTVTVNVLGRNIAARIANLREVEWESLAINFVMVFSPNTLRAAPNNMLATITLPDGTSLGSEAAVARELGKAYPSITAIRVKDALEAANSIFEKVILAVQAAGSVTLLAGALVLAGALATAQRRRLAESAILKSLGATRGRILAAHLAEYLLLALVTGVISVGLGTAVAWATLEGVMDVPFTFTWVAVIQALGIALTLAAIFGGIGTWRVLGAPVVPYLRSE